MVSKSMFLEKTGFIYAKIQDKSGVKKFIFSSSEKLKNCIKFYRPLCYEYCYVKRDKDGLLTFGDKMDKIKIYQKEDKYYYDGLYELLNKNDPIKYSKLPQYKHNLVDTLINLRLIYVEEDIIKFDRTNIFIWEKMYEKSMNWLDYFTDDLINYGDDNVQNI